MWFFFGGKSMSRTIYARPGDMWATFVQGRMGINTMKYERGLVTYSYVEPHVHH